MILRSVIRHVRDQNWFAVGLDFLIVVVGVFIGIQVANWNEMSREQALESDYLVSLEQDFQTTLSDLEQVEQDLVDIIGAMQDLLAQGGEASPTASVDKLNTLFTQLQAMPTFNWTSRTYENLVGSGDLRLIRNPMILGELSAFRRSVRLIELVQSTHEQELVETFQPWIIENMDYLAVHLDRMDGEFPLPKPTEPDRILSMLHEREFRNILVQKWTIATDLLAQNRTMQARAESLLRTLNGELNP